ncbi:GspL periplasmic domain-containing protein [Bordetella sputigena]|uniref:type II secretion system protein GspL n=1 Tax=Bordetella sputigena TaxID=1416810 RepID=UPI0039EF0A84
MKTALRLALPPLRTLNAETPVAFVLLDRDRRILREGELPLREIAVVTPAARVEAVLHPLDTVDTCIALPPLRGDRLRAAAVAQVEPLTLSPTDDLAIAFGPRDSAGQAPVAWTDRATLARGWAVLAEAGFDVAALYPTNVVAPAVMADDAPMPSPAATAHGDVSPSRARAAQGDPAAAREATPRGTEPVSAAPLCLPADARWRQPSPAWSLALPELRPAVRGGQRWRVPLMWTAGALAVWLGGLNIHAAQLAGEGAALRQAMNSRVASAFPDLPVIIDPLKQAQQRVDALRAARGAASDDDFMPLALAAATLLPAGTLQLATLSYQDGVLAIDVDDNGRAPPAANGAPQRQATAMGLTLEATKTGWKLAPTRLTGAGANGDGIRIAPERQP